MKEDKSLYQYYLEKAKEDHNLVVAWFIAFWTYLRVRIEEEKINRRGSSDLFK